MLFDFEAHQPKLWWTDDPIPVALVNCGVDMITEQAGRVLPQWAAHRTFNPNIDPKADRSAKYQSSDIRRYLQAAQDGKPGSSFATALLAEGSLDNNGVAKPSDLYFTTGRLLFIKVARGLLRATNRELIREALEGPWRPRKVSSLGWDPAGYTPYAVAPTKPGAGDKQAYPGVEALAILGMSRHPVFLGKRRTLTQGCSGPWSQTKYTWPLWNKPAGYRAVSSLLAQARSPIRDATRSRWYEAWGVTTILQSQISRNRGQGGGVFGPPRIIWSSI